MTELSLAHTLAPVVAQRRARQNNPKSLNDVAVCSKGRDHNPNPVSVAKAAMSSTWTMNKIRCPMMNWKDCWNCRCMVTETSTAVARTPTGAPYDWTNPAPIMVLAIEHPPTVPLLPLDPPPRPPDIAVNKVLAPLLQEVDVLTSRRRP